MSNSTGNARKVALITGANKGIGLEITRQLGRAGMTVLLGARNSKQGEASAAILRAEGIDVDTIPLDLLSEETISAAAGWIAFQYGRLDVLVNNAGIVDGDDGPPGSAELDAVRRVFDVNFHGLGDSQGAKKVDIEDSTHRVKLCTAWRTIVSVHDACVIHQNIEPSVVRSYPLRCC